MLLLIPNDDVTLYILDDFLPVDNDIEVGLDRQLPKLQKHMIVPLLQLIRVYLVDLLYY